MSEVAGELFSKYAAEAPTTQGRLYARAAGHCQQCHCGGGACSFVHDASAYEGALKHLSLRGQMTLR